MPPKVLGFSNASCSTSSFVCFSIWASVALELSDLMEDAAIIAKMY